MLFKLIPLVCGMLFTMNITNPPVINNPPLVSINTPSNGATVFFGGLNETTFKAAAFDVEDGFNCTLTWKSNVDGAMGTGSTIHFTFGSAGLRTITVIAKDSMGATGQTSIVVNAKNTAPSVSIKSPSSGQTLYQNIPYVFEGTSFDSESFQPLPCNKMAWSSNKIGDSLGGPNCSPIVKFTTTGMRTIKLVGTDAGNLTASATVSVNVVPAPTNSAPIVTILNPANSYLDPSLPANLVGTATDPDGKSPISYEWVLVNGATKPTLGSNSSSNAGKSALPWKPQTNVPFHCGGTTVRIYLYATDADGQTGSAYVDMTVGYPPC